MNKATFSDMPQVYKDEFLKINNDPAALLNMFNKDVQRMQTFKDWTDEEIRSIGGPTLVIAGDADVVLPEHAAAMSHLIPHCQLAIIPGGHGKYLGEITTLTNGKWTQDYVTPLIKILTQYYYKNITDQHKDNILKKFSEKQLTEMHLKALNRMPMT